MPKTSTTRVGQGVLGGSGWGGAARGPQERKAGPGRGKTIKSVAEIMADRGARELAAKRWLEILSDPSHPHHANMVVKAAERLDGAPVQPIDATVTSAVIRAPAEPRDVEDWAATYAPRGDAE